MEVLIDYAYRKDDLERIPIKELAEFVMAAEGRPFETEVSVAFVDDDAMARLNEQYRNTAGPTDVLSFECDSVADDLSAMTLAEPAVFELGDVVIAPDVAERQAQGYGNDFAGEIELLLVHGLLHLCGYDHIEDADAETMETRERALLRQWTEQTGQKEIRR